ncbi:MAG: hypothetical protein H8D56_17715 [Planctomycetes bacterium]|nr:hypothetical protein [Planctomycetota bacterium]MBL7142641.1 hypothetical protein [Phycisphaerae bacterium]
MKQNARNNRRGGNRFFSHLAVEKKKAVLALCLISLMAFMWIKVLTKTSPQAADAGLIAELMNMETQSEPELTISFIELPRVTGRNDMVARDFFASDGWQNFVGGRGSKSVAVEEIDIVSKDDDQEVIRKVAENLKLEAIVSSEDPLAFINNKVLRAGDKLFVGDGIESYEFEVVEIKENIVVMKCRESTITLKMTQLN